MSRLYDPGSRFLLRQEQWTASPGAREAQLTETGVSR